MSNLSRIHAGTYASNRDVLKLDAGRDAAPSLKKSLSKGGGGLQYKKFVLIFHTLDRGILIHDQLL